MPNKERSNDEGERKTEACHGKNALLSIFSHLWGTDMSSNFK
jgi:hypothetical protein